VRVIREGWFSSLVENIRRADTDALAQRLKSGLPYFVYGIVEGKRCNANVRQVNGAVLDYDRIGDIEGFKRLACAQLPWVRYAFRSPRDGVKLLIPYARPVTEEEQMREVWTYLRERADTALNLHSDSTPDPARACFVSYDPDLLENGIWLVFEPGKVRQGMVFTTKDNPACAGAGSKNEGHEGKRVILMQRDNDIFTIEKTFDIGVK